MQPLSRLKNHSRGFRVGKSGHNNKGAQMDTNKSFITYLSAIFMIYSLFFPTTLLAHHGWGWATGEEFELTGEIVEVRLGNPHGEVDLLVDDLVWVIEVGQPWRNDRVGLTDKLIKGTTITVHGHRSAKKSEKLVKAERVVIDSKDYNLYPNRES